jgi:drug/metabolite transporter (DMT)-like permease
VLLGPLRSNGPDYRLVLAVLAGFAGVALILRPTIEQDQLWHGLMGLLSGVLSAVGLPAGHRAGSRLASLASAWSSTSRRRVSSPVPC